MCGWTAFPTALRAAPWSLSPPPPQPNVPSSFWTLQHLVSHEDAKSKNQISEISE